MKGNYLFSFTLPVKADAICLCPHVTRDFFRVVFCARKARENACLFRIWAIYRHKRSNRAGLVAV